MQETHSPTPAAEAIFGRIRESSAVVGVVGLGYVGLPTAVESARSGFRTIGFDVSAPTVEGVLAGRSHIQDVDEAELGEFVGKGLLSATCDMSRLRECDAVLVCVPTPLNKIKDPDLSYVIRSVETIAESLRPGQLVVLESTTFPGTTREVVLDLLRRSGLREGEEFFLCYSPERVDPGNQRWTTRNTPKVIGGLTPVCLEVGSALYGRIFDSLVPVSSPEAAELTKVFENTFRMINIALANELAQACDKLDVDVWEVIEAADTKPFGFMKFTPGPGLGGHCIPLDPHYLSWKMRTLAFKTRLIELASEINSEMPAFVVRKVSESLNQKAKAVRGSRILIIGVSYKRDIDDLRESPAIEIITLLLRMGAQVEYHDPHCPRLGLDEHGGAAVPELNSVELSPDILRSVDAAVIVTDHSSIDYQLLLDEAAIVLDTRGITRGMQGRAEVLSLSGSFVRSRREGSVATPEPSAQAPCSEAATISQKGPHEPRKAQIADR